LQIFDSEIFLKTKKLFLTFFNLTSKFLPLLKN
jgi:hypothetical protein